MADALELFFDTDAESTVRSLWAGLEARGVRSMATAGHARHRPHVSLLVAQHIPAGAARRALDPVVEATDLILRLGSVAVFPGRAGVVYLGVTPTLRLLRLHREVSTQLAGAGVETQRHYLPDAWVPHCTLAQGLSDVEVTTAVRAVKRLRPIDAAVVSVGITDTGTGTVTHLVQLTHSVRAD